MKKELFINHIKNQGVTLSITSDPDFNECLLREFRNIKGFIQYVNFDCQIDPTTGGCKETPHAVKCCCSGCYDSAGYFRRINDIDLTKYARHFSVKTGYWRKGKGCILHHRMRSTTCLTHHCNNNDDRDYTFSVGISILKDRLHDLRRRI